MDTAASIRILPPETAKRIAAGEVIDRPAAALRELLDNALDAAATDIIVDIHGGGIASLRVCDNGSGMPKDDLALSILPHATSKIRELDDLLSLSTLGFRGEALASMAAVAELEMISAVADDQAWRLTSSPGKDPQLAAWHGFKGTIVNLRELFASFPARRRFLKQPSAESALCRQILVDKALPFPQVAFRLSSSGSTSLVLQPGSLLERVCQATSANLDPRLFRELICRGEGFQARIVAGDPALFRTDRKHVQVFVNRRKVQVYGIAQAIEYAYRGALPGGTWPFAYAFIDVDADKADFNIHPAKKDVRLVNTDDIRSALIRAIQDFLGLAARTSLSGKAVNSSSTYHDSPETSWAGIAAVVTEARVAGGFNRTGNLLCQNADSAASCQNSVGGMAGDPASNTSNSGRSSPGNTSGAATGLATDGASGAAASDSERPIHYLGRTLGVFLAYEDGDTLVLLDQHAAHERILYDELCSGKPASQELLVPVVYEAESAEDDAYLERIAPSLEPVGFRLVRDGSTWMLEAAPALLPSSGLGDVFNLIRSRPDPAELLREAIATIACHGAVRDGEALDDRSAQALIRRAMALPDPRCPHGRPIWIRLSRHDAWRAVRRIV